MNTWIKTGLLSIALLGFAACATEPAEPAVEAEVEEAEPMEMEEAPMAAATDAEANCLAAVAEQVGVDAGTLAVLSADASEAGTSVMIEVPEATAPWNCIVDTDGSSVVEVFYTAEG